MFYKNENNNSNTDVQIHSPNHHTFHSEKRLLNLQKEEEERSLLVYLLISLPGTQAVFSPPEYGRFSAGPAVLYIYAATVLEA